MSCLKSSALIAVGATRDSTSAMMWPSARLVPKLATRRVLCDETKPCRVGAAGAAARIALWIDRAAAAGAVPTDGRGPGDKDSSLRELTTVRRDLTVEPAVGGDSIVQRNLAHSNRAHRLLLQVQVEPIAEESIDWRRLQRLTRPHIASTAERSRSIRPSN
jgi:hypothetical protein